MPQNGGLFSKHRTGKGSKMKTFAIGEDVWIIGGMFAGKSGKVKSYDGRYYAIEVFGTFDVINLKAAYLEKIG